MVKQQIIRLYNFADAKLGILVKEKIAFMRRDLASFAGYNITATQINALETAATTFQNFATNVEFENIQVEKTTFKNVKAEQLRMAIRNVMSRVVLKYNEKSAKYKQFGTAELSKQTDSDLLITGKRVVRVGTSLLTDLAGNGLTAALLTQITTLCNEFEVTILDQKTAIANQDIFQEDRVEMGNALYETLVKYTNTGQSIWISTDIAKYNDYVIYNTISGEEEEPIV